MKKWSSGLGRQFQQRRKKNLIWIFNFWCLTFFINCQTGNLSCQTLFRSLEGVWEIHAQKRSKIVERDTLVSDNSLQASGQKLWTIIRIANNKIQEKFDFCLLPAYFATSSASFPAMNKILKLFKSVILTHAASEYQRDELLRWIWVKTTLIVKEHLVLSKRNLFPFS